MAVSLGPGPSEASAESRSSLFPLSSATFVGGGSAHRLGLSSASGGSAWERVLDSVSVTSSVLLFFCRII